MRRLLLAFGLAACSAAPAPPGGPATADVDHFAGALSVPPAPASEVVAVVDGDDIYASDVVAEMAASGKSAPAALDALIAAQLLAREALRRGLADDPDVVAARQRERVRRFVSREFATGFSGPESVSDDEVAWLWKHPEVQAFYEHAEYHTVVYARVPVTKDAPPDEVATARATADAIHDAAVAERPATGDDFKKVAQRVADARGTAIALNRFSTARHDSSVEEFAAAAFSIHDKGEVAEPARTEWGWDILYLDDLIPGRHESLAQATPDIKKQRFETSRKAAFVKWADAFVAKAKVTRDDALLGRIDVDSLVGLQ